MRILAHVLLGILLTLGGMVILFLAIACFAEGLKSPERSGGLAIAGAILVGSGMIAIAIMLHAGFRNEE